MQRTIDSKLEVLTTLTTLLWLVVFVAIGCQAAPLEPDRLAVSANLSSRIGQPIADCLTSTVFTLPPGVSVDDGLTEDEAVAIALWNNAAFQELLVDLGIARSDLIFAGLLPNPEAAYFFEVSGKPFKYLFDFPIESIWLRPIRIQSATKEADRVAQRLTQGGLDLMRDVRQAYADVVLAKERVRIAAESVKLRTTISELADKRLKAGDASQQEAATAKIDALQAEQDTARLGFEVPVQEERLRNLLGLGNERPLLSLTVSPPPTQRTLDVESLTQEAKANRPDALAATEAVSAAEARLRFAKLSWVRVLGIADATSGANGHEFGPGLRFTLPIFNWNQGGIARAEADLERATLNQKTVENQIILDVQRAYLQYSQAGAESKFLLGKVRPELEGAIRRAQLAYRDGNVPIFIVLETTRQLLDNYLREVVLQGDLRRTWAELERSVGRRLDPTAAKESGKHPVEVPELKPAIPPQAR